LNFHLNEIRSLLMPQSSSLHYGAEWEQSCVKATLLFLPIFLLPDFLTLFINELVKLFLGHSTGGKLLAHRRENLIQRRFEDGSFDNIKHILLDFAGVSSCGGSHLRFKFSW